MQQDYNSESVGRQKTSEKRVPYPIPTSLFLHGLSGISALQSSKNMGRGMELLFHLFT